MLGWRTKQQPASAAQLPFDDDTIARSMSTMAEAFVSGAAAEGHHFDYSPENAARLDSWIDRFVAGSPSNDMVHHVIISSGAYIGELIVRNGGGNWTFDLQQGAAAIDSATGLRCFPLNKAAKRITVGPEHSIAQFVQVSLSGEVPPGVRHI